MPEPRAMPMHRRDPCGATIASRLLAAASAAILVGHPAAGVTPPDFARLAPAPMAATTAPHSAAAQDAMLAVPAGTYPMGRNDGPSDERPTHRVALAEFRIDRTEVTNAAFAEFLNALPVAAHGSTEIGRVAPARAIAKVGG
jgi:formylglycine-generating enzyme required for sulfatase activity